MTEDHSAGEEILAISDELHRLRPWVEPVDRDRIRALRLAVDANAGQAPSLGRRLEEIAREVAWRASEIDGCQRALELVPGGAGGTLVKGSTTHKLVSRMERRGSEIAALETEAREFEEHRRQKVFDQEVAEQRLLMALREIRTSTYRARDVELEAIRERRRTRARKALNVDEMWSPNAVLGYRIWAIDRGRLHGAWKPWQTHHLVAECDKPGPIPHTDGRCASVAFGCGIYAAKSVVALLDTHDVTLDSRLVVGLVGLEGRVVEHEQGYRAEEAIVLAAAVGTGSREGHPEVRCYTKEEAIGGLFTDFFGTMRNEPSTAFLPTSTGAMFQEIKHFMDDQVRRHSVWT